MLALGIGIGIPFVQPAAGGGGGGGPPPALDFSALPTAQGYGTNSMYLITGVI